MWLAVVLAVAGRRMSGLELPTCGQGNEVRPGWGGGQARGVLVALTAALVASASTASVESAEAPTVEGLVQSAGPSARTRGAAGTCVAHSNWGVRRDDLAYSVARIVNRYRRIHGLRPLQLEYGLMRSAIWKAQHMAHFFYFGHSDPAPPVNRGVPQRLAACGFTTGGSENIAYGFDTAREVVKAWLRSPGHRRNIVSKSWRYLGVGVAVSNRGGTFWAQNFG
jgi:uncharacterized protein YkwD